MNAKPMLIAGLLAFAASTDSPARDESVLQRFNGTTAWLNSPPLSAGDLRGKVVLVDFWTYSCINWIRTAPFVRAWAHKYRDQGLVVIGVHTPEFEFEKKLDNVRRAVHDFRVTYPVAIDSDYAVWQSFSNDAWPALYLVDADGRVRYRHLGEGEYERTERMIQQLLAENGRTATDGDLVVADGTGIEAAADWASLRSPENYVGVRRTENFASPGGPLAGRPRTYPPRSGLRLIIGR